MLREELCILASYCLSLIRKKSVLEELGVMKLAGDSALSNCQSNFA